MVVMQQGCRYVCVYVCTSIKVIVQIIMLYDISVAIVLTISFLFTLTGSTLTIIEFLLFVGFFFFLVFFFFFFFCCCFFFLVVVFFFGFFLHASKAYTCTYLY